MPTPYDFSTSLLIDDFDTFVRYLESKARLSLTGAGDLKAADLWAINERVNYKAPHYVTSRSRQADYPLLSFLYQVITTSRLAVVQFDKAYTLVPDANRLEAYQGLTQEEKYVFLLETAWCYVDWATLDGDDRSGQGAQWFREGIEQLLQNPTGTEIRLFTSGWLSGGSALKNDLSMMLVFPTVNIYVRAGYWFGWYDTREVILPKRDKYALEIDRVTLSDWGHDCLTVLRRNRPFHFWNKNAFSHFISEVDENYNDPVDVNTFADVFRSLLDEPELVSLYPINPNPPTGTYWLRVNLPHHGVSRTIAMPATSTLDDLHLLIQKAFAFDNDHLYGFYLNPKNLYNGEQYFDPRTEEGWADGYPAAETTLASLNLYEGQHFLYVFDFGDNWEFWITMTRHLPDESTKKARVVDQIGKAPKQYDNDW
jgi:hypothetical protein